VSQPTNTGDETRYLGIVADGPTDQEIMARFLKTLVEPTGPCEERIIGKNLSILMKQFRDKASRAGQYGLFDKPAVKLRKGVVSLIHSAVGEFRDAISRDLYHSDVLVLSTDAEWPVKTEEWHEVERIVVIYRILDGAIAEFYNAPHNRGNWEYLPLIVPLVLFPSTDVLIAAAKRVSFEFRGMKATDLKQKLYGCSDLNQLRADGLKRMALDYLTQDACTQIYSSVPESRTLLRTLTWCQYCEFFGYGSDG